MNQYSKLQFIKDIKSREITLTYLNSIVIDDMLYIHIFETIFDVVAYGILLTDFFPPLSI